MLDSLQTSLKLSKFQAMFWEVQSNKQHCASSGEGHSDGADDIMAGQVQRKKSHRELGRLCDLRETLRSCENCINPY